MEVLREEYDIELLSKVFKTITAGNVKEFSELSKLEEYRILVYFTHPYLSWERPQNEMHNRSFRRFVPKGISIGRYTAEQILEYTDSMNSFP